MKLKKPVVQFATPAYTPDLIFTGLRVHVGFINKTFKNTW